MRGKKVSEGLVMKYFVLNPTSKKTPYARASRQAIVTYANSIKKHDPLLSQHLLDWMYKIVEGEK